MDTYAIKMEHIQKGFSGVPVLKEVDFELKEGEIHALLGENGAGKSTLIKILSGAHEKDSGTVKVFGKEVEIHNPQDAHALGIQCIYQELSLIQMCIRDRFLYAGQILILSRAIFRGFGPRNSR